MLPRTRVGGENVMTVMSLIIFAKAIILPYYSVQFWDKNNSFFIFVIIGARNTMPDKIHQDYPRTYGFPPLMCEKPKILIMGTLPGGESLVNKQYYFSNSNRIWKVLCHITGEPIPINYQQKQALLAKYNIVLWDYYESAIRPGSNDKDIRDGKPNDIAGFLGKNLTIKVIAINGFGKYRDFGVQIKSALANNPDLADIRVLRLPETSGSNKNYGWGNLNKLAAEWEQIFD